MCAFAYGRKFPYIILLFVSAMLWQCAEPRENPDLLNAPIGLDSIRVRLFNFGGDRVPLVLQLQDGQQTQPVEFSGLSQVIGSTSDSSFITIIDPATGESLFTSTIRVRFFRNTFQTVVAVPTAFGEPDRQPVDSLLVLSAELDPRFGSNPDAARLRFLNAVPESNFQYSLRLGCPNGQALALQSPYKSISSYSEFEEGEIIVSLIRHRVSTNDTRVEGFYRLPLKRRSSQCFFIYEGAEGVVALLINERAHADEAITILEKVEESRADIRVVNLTDETISAVKLPDIEVASQQQPFFAGAYQQITACLSEAADTIMVYSGGDTARADFTLNILEEYTAFIGKNRSRTKHVALARPLLPRERPQDNAVVRCVNLLNDTSNVTIAIGTRTVTSTTGEISTQSGKVLASNLQFRSVTDPVNVTPGPLPVTAFSLGGVSRLLSAVNGEIEGGKSYFLVIKEETDGRISTYLLEEKDQEEVLSPLPKGVFTQIANGVASLPFMTIRIDPIIRSFRLVRGDNFATILPTPVAPTIQIENSDVQGATDPSKRLLVVASGSVPPTLTSFLTDPIVSGRAEVRWRIINAATDVPNLNISADSLMSREVFARNIQYQQAVFPNPLLLDRRITVVFWEPEADEPLFRVTNIQLLLGKAYTLVFFGSREEGYSSLIMEEF